MPSTFAQAFIAAASARPLSRSAPELARVTTSDDQHGKVDQQGQVARQRRLPRQLTDTGYPAKRFHRNGCADRQADRTPASARTSRRITGTTCRKRICASQTPFALAREDVLHSACGSDQMAEIAMNLRKEDQRQRQPCGGVQHDCQESERSGRQAKQRAAGNAGDQVERAQTRAAMPRGPATPPSARPRSWLAPPIGK